MGAKEAGDEDEQTSDFKENKWQIGVLSALRTTTDM